MATIKQIRELCAKVAESEGAEFEAAILELAQALELYAQDQQKSGNKSAKAAN